MSDEKPSSLDNPLEAAKIHAPDEPPGPPAPASEAPEEVGEAPLGLSEVAELLQGKHTHAELSELAREFGVPGRTKMSKAELAEAIAPHLMEGDPAQRALDASEEHPDAAEAPPEPPPAPAVERCRVLHTTTISWGSQMVRLGAGVIVSDESHGPGALERMRRAGVPLEPVEG